VLVCSGPELAVHDVPDAVPRHAAPATVTAFVNRINLGNSLQDAGSPLSNRAEYERSESVPWQGSWYARSAVLAHPGVGGVPFWLTRA
jgi:hypothetical protein